MFVRIIRHSDAHEQHICCPRNVYWRTMSKQTSETINIPEQRTNWTNLNSFIHSTIAQCECVCVLCSPLLIYILSATTEQTGKRFELHRHRIAARSNWMEFSFGFSIRPYTYRSPFQWWRAERERERALDVKRYTKFDHRAASFCSFFNQFDSIKCSFSFTFSLITASDDARITAIRLISVILFGSNVAVQKLVWTLNRKIIIKCYQMSKEKTKDYSRIDDIAQNIFLHSDVNRLCWTL